MGKVVLPTHKSTRNTTLPIAQQANSYRHSLASGDSAPLLVRLNRTLNS